MVSEQVICVSFYKVFLFSKDIPYTHSGVYKVKIIFYNPKIVSFFSVLTLTLMAQKAMVDKISSDLLGSKAVAPHCNNSECILYH